MAEAARTLGIQRPNLYRKAVSWAFRRPVVRSRANLDTTMPMNMLASMFLALALAPPAPQTSAAQPPGAATRPRKPAASPGQTPESYIIGANDQCRSPCSTIRI